MFISYEDLHHLKTLPYDFKRWKKLFPDPVEVNSDLCRKCANNDIPLNAYIRHLVSSEALEQFKESNELAVKAQCEALLTHMRNFDKDFSGPMALYHDRMYRAFLGLIEAIPVEIMAGASKE